VTESSASGAPSDFTTVVEELNALVDAGYDGNFTVTDEGLIRCPECRTESDPTSYAMRAIRRLEGASDPADMQAILALSCPVCGRKGAAVLHFGPDATAGEAAVLLAIEDLR
jgi:hypothetical protein